MACASGHGRPAPQVGCMRGTSSSFVSRRPTTTLLIHRRPLAPSKEALACDPSRAEGASCFHRQSRHRGLRHPCRRLGSVGERDESMPCALHRGMFCARDRMSMECACCVLHRAAVANKCIFLTKRDADPRRNAQSAVREDNTQPASRSSGDASIRIGAPLSISRFRSL